MVNKKNWLRNDLKFDDTQISSLVRINEYCEVLADQLQFGPENSVSAWGRGFKETKKRSFKQ